MHSLLIQIVLTIQKGYGVDSIIMETKFGINNATKANVKHTKQSDSISCGVMICYCASDNKW